MVAVTSEQLKNSLTELVNSYRKAYRGTIVNELPEMTFRQFVYLDAIVKMDYPTYGEVAEKFKVTKPAVTAIVNRLIGLGYLKRVQSQEDRRIYHLLPSAEGEKILTIESAAMAEYAMDMEACLTGPEQEQFVCIVKKIREYQSAEKR